MIIILIKRSTGGLYQASSLDEKLEKEISSKPEGAAKKLAKEFQIQLEQIHKFWITNEKNN